MIKIIGLAEFSFIPTTHSVTVRQIRLDSVDAYSHTTEKSKSTVQ